MDTRSVLKGKSVNDTFSIDWGRGEQTTGEAFQIGRCSDSARKKTTTTIKR